MRIVVLVLLGSLLVGCNRDASDGSRGIPQENGGVKVRAPGVKVDVQKNDSGKPKVEVNVQK